MVFGCYPTHARPMPLPLTISCFQFSQKVPAMFTNSSTSPASLATARLPGYSKSPSLAPTDLNLPSRKSSVLRIPRLPCPTPDGSTSMNLGDPEDDDISWRWNQCYSDGASASSSEMVPSNLPPPYYRTPPRPLHFLSILQGMPARYTVLCFGSRHLCGLHSVVLALICSGPRWV